MPELMPVATATVAAAVATPRPGPTPTGFAADLTTQAQSNRPAWLLPLVIASGFAIVVILAIAFWQTQNRRVS